MWIQPAVIEKKAYFSAQVLRQMAVPLLQSPYLQQNVLNQRFETTQGFSLLLADLSLLPEAFQFLNPYLQTLDPRCNYFYLNVLRLNASAKVDRHIDHSVRGYHAQLPFPRRVSVLYLQADALEGGELQFYDRQDRVFRQIKPQTGTWVSFKGRLKHGITPVVRCEQPRLSLVCEQYRLRAAQRAYLPEVTLKSSARFDAFLSEALPETQVNTL